ncbi:MAG TPA: heavy metal-responsive transcriptional regulator [Candidatus Solibacter sp.]|nr:heavy metal-responsive transcriptional regulator [Candidatus Solibacter sp.]
MRIGELSAKAGVNTQTIRFYEREKLLRKPVRTSSGYRTFTGADLERVRFIKDSQQLGFSLKEIKELLEIHESAKSFAGGARTKSKEWEKAFRIAKERLALINQKIAFLNVLKKPLTAVLEQPDAEKAMVCPASLMARPAADLTGKPARSGAGAASPVSKKTA